MSTESLKAPDAPTPSVADEPLEPRQSFALQSAVVAIGWLATNFGLALTDLPLRFVLKEEVGLTATAVSGFFALGQVSNYVKPLAGVMTDSIPFCGTRRRHYLLVSLVITGLMWILLSLAPRSYGIMLAMYVVMYTGVMFTSTTLGGVMVEIGSRYRAAGRLTAQRIACFKLAELAGAPIAGWLSTFPFLLAGSLGGGLHLALAPFLMVFLPKEPPAKLVAGAWTEVARQGRVLIRNRTLLGAAGMIFLLAAAPALKTPLFFYQRNVLQFSGPFIGILGLVTAAGGVVGAVLYFFACRKYELKRLVGISIVVHALGALFYLNYHDQNSALIASAINGLTAALAMLPVYDIAARATPKGSEAIGYAVMMSVWNFTNMGADVVGSKLFDSVLHQQLMPLVWIDAATTLVVILAVPFMPKALSMREDQVPH
jgi:predicted MFS family arabinose efflux permease